MTPSEGNVNAPTHQHDKLILLHRVINEGRITSNERTSNVQVSAYDYGNVDATL